MANLLKLSGAASALLLLAALLAAGARAEIVTTAECEARGGGWRVRRYPVDSDAFALYMFSCNLTGVEQQTLTGLPALSWLWLQNNKLRELPLLEHVCPSLTQLYLYDNQLTEINNAGAFSACTKLYFLYLYNNQIQFIHHSVFTPLTDLRNLYLHNNKIRFIPDEMFSNNGKLERLYLYGNMITHLPPEFASKLKRAAPNLYEFHVYNNPWHCACLIELLADVRRAGVRNYNDDVGDVHARNYIKQAYNGTGSVCNYISMLDYPCRKIREINFIAHGVR